MECAPTSQVVRFGRVNRSRVMNQSIRLCTTADGVRLAYAVSGAGPPLVMSATWVSHLEHQWRSFTWRPWLDVFTREYKVLRHDVRGCGLSDRNVSNLSFETCVSDFECVINAASFQRFALVGACGGGPAAIEYAAQHPERVSHLVLYATYARGQWRRTDRPDEIEKGRVLLDLTRLGWAQEDHTFLQIWASRYQPGGTLEHLRSWSDQMRAATSADTAVRLLQIVWNVDVQEAASKIKCPVLIVHPEGDLTVPVEEARLLASLIPDCRFVPLDSANHMLLADEPAWARLYGEVRDFLGQSAIASVASGNTLPLGELTSRERAVLEAIAKGLDNGEIAASLRLSEKTIRNYVTRLFDKIHVKHRYEAIVLARDAGSAVASGSVARPDLGTFVPDLTPLSS